MAHSKHLLLCSAALLGTMTVREVNLLADTVREQEADLLIADEVSQVTLQEVVDYEQRYQQPLCLTIRAEDWGFDEPYITNDSSLKPKWPTAKPSCVAVSEGCSSAIWSAATRRAHPS